MTNDENDWIEIEHNEQRTEPGISISGKWISEDEMMAQQNLTERSSQCSSYLIYLRCFIAFSELKIEINSFCLVPRSGTHFKLGSKCLIFDANTQMNNESIHISIFFLFWSASLWHVDYTSLNVQCAYHECCGKIHTVKRNLWKYSILSDKNGITFQSIFKCDQHLESIQSLALLFWPFIHSNYATRIYSFVPMIQYIFKIIYSIWTTGNRKLAT